MHHKSSAWPLLCALLLGVGTMFAPRPAQAFFCMYDYTYTQTFYGICMTEITQGFNKAEWVNGVYQNAQKIISWKDQINKQKERIQQLSPGGFNLGELTGNRAQIEDLKERPVDEGVDAVCGKKGRSRVGDEQYQICKAKQELVNRRFNLMVKMFKDSDARDDKLAQIRGNRGGISGAMDAGKLVGNTNATKQLKAATVNDGQNYLTTMELYTSMIAALDAEMARSARKALTGEGAEQKGPFGLPPIANKVIQGTALKVGLKAAESRDL